MSVEYIGTMPYLPARKDKYENEPTRVWTVPDDDYIYAYKNINGHSFNVVTREMSSEIKSPHTRERQPSVVPDVEIRSIGPQENLLTVKPTTLASGDVTDWSRPHGYDHCSICPFIQDRIAERYELRLKDRVLETFVSWIEPFIVMVREEPYVMVETPEHGYDIYSLKKLQG